MRSAATARLRRRSRAQALQAAYPRGSSAKSPPAAGARTWLKESYALAKVLAYRPDAPRATSPEAAEPPARAYHVALQQAAAERVAFSGYRLADLLEQIIRE